MRLLVGIDAGHAVEATGSIVGEWGFDSVRTARFRLSVLDESHNAHQGHIVSVQRHRGNATAVFSNIILEEIDDEPISTIKKFHVLARLRLLVADLLHEAWQKYFLDEIARYFQKH